MTDLNYLFIDRNYFRKKMREENKASRPRIRSKGVRRSKRPKVNPARVIMKVRKTKERDPKIAKRILDTVEKLKGKNYD